MYEEIKHMSWDELSDLADICDQVYYLYQRYTPGWIDEDGFRAYRKAVEDRLDVIAEQDRKALNKDYERSVL